MSDDAPAHLPYGTEAITAWARQRGLHNQPRPEQGWFRAWEPLETLVSPAYYFNACTVTLAPGTITVVEPWTEIVDTEPIDRALYAFVAHPGLRRRASFQAGGDHFMSRVAFIVDPPPPIVKLGDAVWDENVTTRATSPDEAQAAVSPSLRRLLQGWGFKGHVELRPGGAIVYAADLKPVPAGYDRAISIAREIVDRALRRG